ncbi:mevalonate kinase [Candidatus Micrarchaeota archaeon]|nr:mevalonate kinase [Candidatus Micrarchaeota archaeon]
MAVGSGSGKLILFGEHFVVFGLPAIVSAIGSKTVASIEFKDSPGWQVEDNRPETLGYKKEKFSQQKASIDLILKAAGVDVSKKGIKIVLGGDLQAASGVGASAASCAAIARALNDLYSLKLDNRKINELAFEGEKGYHGTPSGIDNTAAVFGGLLVFKKDLQLGKNSIELIKARKPVEVVVGNTGLTSDTKFVVGEVKKLKEENPVKFNEAVKKYQRLLISARVSIEQGDWKKAGGLLDENHALLQQLAVSCKELDLLVDTARQAGAFGAKMTGTGRGGLMFALTPGKQLQDKVLDAVKLQGFEAFATTIG